MNVRVVLDGRWDRTVIRGGALAVRTTLPFRSPAFRHQVHCSIASSPAEGHTRGAHADLGWVPVWEGCSFRWATCSSMIECTHSTGHVLHARSSNRGSNSKSMKRFNWGRFLACCNLLWFVLYVAVRSRTAWSQCFSSREPIAFPNAWRS